MQDVVLVYVSRELSSRGKFCCSWGLDVQGDSSLCLGFTRDIAHNQILAGVRGMQMNGIGNTGTAGGAVRRNLQ